VSANYVLGAGCPRRELRTHFILEDFALKRRKLEELVGVFEDEIGHRFVTSPFTADFQKWTVNGQQSKDLLLIRPQTTGR